MEAPAKLNLNLFVTGRRSDGYHTLDTIMQTLELHDDVSICVEPQDRMEEQTVMLHPLQGEERLSVLLSVTGITEAVTGPPEKNLVIKALSAYLETFGLTSIRQMAGASAPYYKVSLKLHKAIPSGAGMGGGSSDAAAMLRILAEKDKLWRDPVAQKRLHRLATSIGADVPFLLYGGTARCTGIGEILDPIEAMPVRSVLLLRPDLEVSTVEAFRRLDQSEGMRQRERTIDPVAFVEAYRHMDRQRLVALGGNDFLKYGVGVEAMLALREILVKTDAILTDLSGSGSTIFGIYPDDVHAKEAQAYVKSQISHESVWQSLTSNRPDAYNRYIM